MVIKSNSFFEDEGFDLPHIMKDGGPACIGTMVFCERRGTPERVIPDVAFMMVIRRLCDPLARSKLRNRRMEDFCFPKIFEGALGMRSEQHFFHFCGNARTRKVCSKRCQ